jgi:hypothetical protein
MRINDPACQGIDTAPDAQPLVAKQDRPLNLGGNDQIRHEITLFRLVLRAARWGVAKIRYSVSPCGIRIANVAPDANICLNNHDW